MDYEKMKALLETNRQASAAQHKSQVKAFPKPDSTDSGYGLAKERIAA